MTPAIQDAIEELARHSAVVPGSISVQESASGVVVSADFDCNLPSTWRAEGTSPSGVLPVERVEFHFPPEYPQREPVPKLRSDFNRNLPHINPHDAGDMVPPCLVYGRTLDVLHNEGIGRLYDQMAAWLDNAVEGRLIDARQGWEPTRRDEFFHHLAIDVDEAFDCRTPSFGAFKAYRVNARWTRDDSASYGDQIANATTTLTPKALIDIYNDIKISGKVRGANVLLGVCWPQAEASGKPPAIAVYQADTVKSFADLRNRAAEVNCERAFSAFTSNLHAVAEGVKARGKVPVYVVLAIRRPFAVIGQTSDYEFLAYRFSIGAPSGLGDEVSIGVSPVAFRMPLSRKLLARASGLSEDKMERSARSAVGFLGCGSLGSKIALHFTRSGSPTRVIIDKGWFSPHNAARHGLTPVQFDGPQGKAEQLAQVIAEFGGGTPEIHSGSIQSLPFKHTQFSRFFERSSSLLVNTTASPSVRSYLSQATFDARVMEASLMNLGQNGMMTMEGRSRNPNTADLAFAAYEILRGSCGLRAPEDQQVAILGVGVGCNSVTLPMPDSAISLIAAGAGTALTKWAGDRMPDEGYVAVAQVQPDGMSVNWTHLSMGPTQLTADAGWDVRILDRAHKKIVADVERHSAVETGGIIVGRVSRLDRVVTITDVLDAPPDSRRSASEFVLGVEGRQEAERAYNASGQGVLWCLGTWHSHLQDIGPSPTDFRTADSLALTMGDIMVLLIRRPSGYSAIVRDAIRA